MTSGKLETAVTCKSCMARILCEKRRKHSIEVGQKFGKWTVVREDEVRLVGPPAWLVVSM